AGAAIGILGGFVVLLASGSPVGHPPQHALPLAGAVLLAAGWLTVGAAVLRTRAHRIGDGLLLVACAVPLALGGFLLDGVPRLAALLLLAAGVGLCGSALDPRYRRRAAQ
ncbi:MAG TPA: hypothetical protein VJT31_40695, partial [Rugosimonospora sp.]|nr:hypothetical protein [Rugosimonospora sp.]